MDNTDGTGPETLSLLNEPPGFYDVWVHSYTRHPFEGNEKIEVRLVSGDGQRVGSHESIYVTSARQNTPGPIWWQVGFLNRTRVAGGEGAATRYVSQFVEINRFGSSPTSSGCRIPGETVSFAANASGGAVRLSSGISVAVAPGAVMGSRRETGTLQVSVTQLLVAPANAPEGASFGGPVVYLEPSGFQFKKPGVNVSMPLLERLPEDHKMRAGVFRLVNGVWTEVRSESILTPFTNEDELRSIVEQRGFTLTFSAYALIILAKPVFQTSATSSLITTTPPPREISGDESAQWWILYIVYPVAGVAGALLLLTCCFRGHYGRWPLQKGSVHDAMHPDFLPVKSKGQSGLRLKLLEQESKSRRAYTEGHELSKKGTLMQESVDANIKAEMDQEMGLVMVKNKNQKTDAKYGADVSVPPHPISELVRSGVLMPPRSSVVDGESLVHES